jgi:glyoxylase-like metal-dependent hydrolase (beta-lactamase superfamily II)
VADHAEVTKRFPNAKVLIHRLDEPKLQAPGASSFVLPFEIPPRSADAYVEDGQKLRLGDVDVEVIHTPGHAPGHVMYYIPSEKVLVGGDLIIGGSIGRTDLPDSDHAELEKSIRRVMQLPGDTRLLPGHGDVSTLDDERRQNPFVQEALRTK